MSKKLKNELLSNKENESLVPFHKDNITTTFTFSEEEDRSRKAKVIKLNGNETIADGNSVEIPFIAEYKGPIIYNINYIWEQKTKGETVKLTLHGHSQLGVPTLREFDVLMAIQRIFVEEKTINGKATFKDDFSYDNLTINFTYGELFKELGYKGNPGSNTVESLRKSIEILKGTTLTGMTNLFIDEKFIGKKSGVSYLDDFKIIEVNDKNGKLIKDIISVRLGVLCYGAILNNHKMFYNINKYLSIKSTLPRKLYLLALKWSGNKNFCVMSIDTAIQRLPMKQNEYKYKKLYIKRAIKKLNESGIVKVVIDDDERLWFYFKDVNNDNNDIALHSKYFLNEYLNYESVEDQFIDYGFSREEINIYLDVERLKYIQALLRMIKTLKLYKDNKNIEPKEMIIKFLKNKLKIDEKYYIKDNKCEAKEQLSLKNMM